MSFCTCVFVCHIVFVCSGVVLYPCICVSHCICNVPVFVFCVLCICVSCTCALVSFCTCVFVCHIVFVMYMCLYSVYCVFVCPCIPELVFSHSCGGLQNRPLTPICSASHNAHYHHHSLLKIHTTYITNLMSKSLQPRFMCSVFFKIKFNENAKTSHNCMDVFY